MKFMIIDQKLGQSDLVYGSKLSAIKSGHEQAFSRYLGLAVHEMFVVIITMYLQSYAAKTQRAKNRH